MKLGYKSLNSPKQKKQNPHTYKSRNLHPRIVNFTVSFAHRNIFYFMYLLFTLGFFFFFRKDKITLHRLEWSDRLCSAW